MGMNIVLAQWIWDLKQQGALPNHKSILEMARHDLSGISENRHRAYAEFVRRNFGDSDEAKAFLSNAFDASGQIKTDATPELYKLFGLTDYSSVDFIDEKATFRADLNEPLDLGQQFDVVGDYGTSEHIFNIGQSFRTTHNHLRVGGVALLMLPIMGRIHHGFYNIHHILYRSLAVANRYEVLRLDYLPDLHSAVPRVERTSKPATFYDIRNTDAPGMSWRFYLADILSVLRRSERAMAYVFAALRKTEDKPFIWPQQLNKYSAGKE